MHDIVSAVLVARLAPVSVACGALPVPPRVRSDAAHTSPTAVQGKVARKKLRDRRQLLITTADKIAVRDYVSSTIGPEHLTRLYAVADRWSGLEWDGLPESFVIKANHTSGAVRIVPSKQAKTEPPVMHGAAQMIIRMG